MIKPDVYLPFNSGYARYDSIPGFFFIYWEIFEKLNFFDFFFEKNESLVEDPQLTWKVRKISVGSDTASQ